jgi:hypothetical protein
LEIYREVLISDLADTEFLGSDNCLVSVRDIAEEKCVSCFSGEDLVRTSVFQPQKDPGVVLPELIRRYEGFGEVQEIMVLLVELK